MEFHRSTSASRQSQLSSHLNATDVSRGAITSDGRLLTRTGLYRAAPAEHRQQRRHSHPHSPTTLQPHTLSLSLSLSPIARCQPTSTAVSLHSTQPPLSPFLRKLALTLFLFLSVSATHRFRLTLCRSVSV